MLEHIRELLNTLRPVCSGLSLCGAGAGGFAIVILKTNEAGVVDMGESLDVRLQDYNLKHQSHRGGFYDQATRHSIVIDSGGICSENQKARHEAITSFLDPLIPL